MGLNAPAFIAHFDEFLAAFEKHCPFTRPGQVEGHRSVIARRRQLGSAVASIHDAAFLQGLYRTLQAWGIGSRGSHLVPFDSFTRALQAAEARAGSNTTGAVAEGLRRRWLAFELEPKS